MVGRENMVGREKHDRERKKMVERENMAGRENIVGREKHCKERNKAESENRERTK